MARLAPKLDTLRLLFARSGNQCAFPDCRQLLFNDKNQFIAQVCHIEGATEGGERFNSESSDEERRAYDNLLLLCYPHHVETDDVAEFPTERLVGIKQAHENIFSGGSYLPNEESLLRLKLDMESYWGDIDRLNKYDHIYADSELAMEIDANSPHSKVLESAESAVGGIENLLIMLRESDEQLIDDLKSLLKLLNINIKELNKIEEFENPFFQRNWDLHNLGTPNWTQRARIDLVHLEVKYLELYLKVNIDDPDAAREFEVAKAKLREYAESAMHVD